MAPVSEARRAGHPTGPDLTRAGPLEQGRFPTSDQSAAAVFRRAWCVLVTIALLQPLRHRDFRLLWIGQSVSMVGNALYSVALPFQILALGGSAAELGIGFAVYATAQLVTILFGGALVDRVARRPVILICDLASALVVGMIALLGARGDLRIEHLYLASAFAGLSASFYLPALSAIVPDLVPKDILVAGNSLRALSRQVARVSTPLLGGLLVASVGPPIAFAIDALTFVISFIVFAAARPRTHVRAPSSGLLHSVREGFHFVFSVDWIWVTIVGFAGVNLFYFGSLSVALPLLVRDVLAGGALTYGLLGSAAGVGEVLGTLLIGSLATRRLGKAMYGAYAVTALALAGYGIAPVLPVVLAAAAIFAGGLVAANTLWESALQTHVPRALIGRVTSVDYFGSYLTAPVAPLLAALLVGRLSPGGVFVISGVGAFVFIVVVVLLVPSIRRLEVESAPEAAATKPLSPYI
jgi:MFS family permease